MKLADKYGKLSSQAATDAGRLTFNDNQLRQIQTLSQEHPDDINLHMILAQRYTELQQYGPAHDEYIAIQKLDPKDKRVQPGLDQLAKLQAANQ
jgi:hypothetical protein